MLNLLLLFELIKSFPIFANVSDVNVNTLKLITKMVLSYKLSAYGIIKHSFCNAWIITKSMHKSSTLNRFQL